MPLDIYKASAGSGKTFMLTRRYIEYLLSRDESRSHEHILAVTFTKKATGEMKSRILTELSLLADGKASSHTDYLTERLALSEDELRRRSRRALVDILRHYSRFSVSTIDSFFQQIVRQFAHELGLSGAYNLDLDEQSIRYQAVDDLFFSLRSVATDADSRQLLQWLEQWSLRNIEEDQSWNPRSKMRTLAAQLSRESVLELIRDTTGKLHDKEFLQNYRSELFAICKAFEKRYYGICLEAQTILERHHLSKSDFKTGAVTLFYKDTIEEPGVNFAACAESVERCYTKEAPRKADIEAAYSEGLGKCYRDLCSLLDSEDYGRYLSAKAIVKNLYATGVLGDIVRQIDEKNLQLQRLPMSYIGQLLGEVVNESYAPFIYEKLGQRIRHFMIDEFQDTSRLQWHNFRPLVKESVDNNFGDMVVGDIKQSIYRWRNSDWQLLGKQIATDITPNTTHTLSSNYRSSREVVEFNNFLFEHYVAAAQLHFNATNEGAERHATTISDAYSDVHQQWQKELSGHVDVVAIPVGKGEKFNDLALDRLPAYVDTLLARGTAPRNIAILARRHKDLQSMASVLIGHGLRVSTDEGLELSTHPAVSFVIDTLRWLATPSDRTVVLLRYTHYLSATQHLSNAESVRQALEGGVDLSALDAMLLRQREYDLFSLCEFILESYGLRQSGDAETYLNTLLDTIYHYSDSHSSDLVGFLRWWDDVGSSRCVSMPERDDAIRLLTIHKSKGLEFPVVMLPMCSWAVADTRSSTQWYVPHGEPFDALPITCVETSSELRRTCFKDEYTDEVMNSHIDSLNMLYVALTRAQRELVLFCPQKVETAKRKKKEATEEEQISAISDVGTLILYVLGQHQSEVVHATDTGYEVGNADWNVSDASSASATTPQIEQFEAGKSYPIGERLRLRRSALEYMQSDRFRQLNLGTMMHELLSHIRTTADLESAIRDMQESGRINRTDALSLKGRMDSFFELVHDHSWFTDRWDAILTERDIITPQADIYRPDRVMLRGDEAQVVDYKFGNAERDEHEQQVRHYIRLLEQMGYRCRGWLIYAELRKIKEVL